MHKHLYYEPGTGSFRKVTLDLSAEEARTIAFALMGQVAAYQKSLKKAHVGLRKGKIDEALYNEELAFLYGELAKTQNTLFGLRFDLSPQNLQAAYTEWLGI